MKLIIDVDNKTLQVEEGVSIGFLLLYLENNLKDWKEYKLVSNTNNAEQITPLTFPSTPTYSQWPNITYTNYEGIKLKRPQYIVKSSSDEL